MFGKIFVSIYAVIFLGLGAVPPALAEEDKKDLLELSLGTIRTEAENAAMGLLLKYVPDEVFVPSSLEGNESSGWILDFVPHVQMQTGENDAFNGLIAKITGYYSRFKIAVVDGIETPAYNQSFSLFPFSIGIESNRNFDNVNVLGEFGYVPVGKRQKTFGERFGVNNRVGVFLQAGYKVEVEEAAAGAAAGMPDGARDESEEAPDSELLRVKFDARGKFKIASFLEEKYRVSFLPSATAWYDIANSETYHKLEAVLRFTLSKDRHFDLRYEDGSGAPNFNEGEQFSANLTISF